MSMRRPAPDDLRDDDEDYTLQVPSFGKDEMNLAEFPFALLRRQGDKRTSFSYEGYVTGPDQKRHKQKWTVHGLSGMGLPNEYDERVMIALMAVSATEGFKSRKVPFSVYRLLRIMGLTDSTRDYDNIERSLDRLVGVTIFAEGSFWDNGAKAFMKQKSAFHIIERVWLAYKEEDETIKEAEGVHAYFVWSEDLWQSIQDGYIKNLNLSFYYALETPLARRLYRFLDKRLYQKQTFEIDVFELAGRLGMATYKYPSQILEKLQPGVDELIRERFLARAGSKKVGKYTRLWVEKHGAPDTHSLSVLPADAVEAEDFPAIVLDMMEFGVSQPIAEDLAKRFDDAYIQTKLAYLRRQLRRNRRSIRNPSGWLRKAIEEDFTPPDSYTEQLFFADTAVAGETDKDAGPETTLTGTLEAETSLFLRSTWRRVLDEVKLGVTLQTFEHLFARTSLRQLDSRSALIEVPERGMMEWIEQRFTNSLQRSIEIVTGYAAVELRFIVGEGE
jgi:hypothetical protein